MKPEGYNSLCPYLVVENGENVIDFLDAVFDATVLRRYDEPDGSLIHAEIRIDDSIVMLGGASEEWPAFPSLVHVYVPDVDLTFDLAIEAGAESVQEPRETEGDPDRRGSVRGPGGNTWAIATQVD